MCKNRTSMMKKETQTSFIVQDRTVVLAKRLDNFFKKKTQ